MRLGFCARYILFQLMCALSIGISRTVLNGNVFELNFAFDDGRQKSYLSSTFKTVSTNPQSLYLSFPDVDEPSACKRCAW